MAGFVADGQARAKRSLEYAAAVAVIRVEVEAEFEPLIAKASFFGRIRLRHQRGRRIEREIEDLAPGRGLCM